MPKVDDLLDIKDMLTEHSRSWTHQWKMEGLAEGRREGRKQGLEEGRRKGHQEGRKEGRKEGRLEGLKEGQAAILQSLLTRKFGPLPEPVRQRLKNAGSAQLESWSLALLDAHSIEEVFGD